MRRSLPARSESFPLNELSKSGYGRGGSLSFGLYMRLERYAVLAILTLTGCSFYPDNKSVGVPFCAAGEGEIYELAVYRVGVDDSTQLAQARNKLRTSLGRYPGFRCALPLTALEDPTRGVDLIVWRSMEDAQHAAREVAQNREIAALHSSSRIIEATGFFQNLPNSSN